MFRLKGTKINAILISNKNCNFVMKIKKITQYSIFYRAFVLTILGQEGGTYTVDRIFSIDESSIFIIAHCD